MSNRSDRDRVRIRLDDLTHDQLDALYERLEDLEAETAKLIRWHREDGVALTKARRAVEHLTDRYRGAEAATARVRDLHRDAYADTPDAGASCTAGCGTWPCPTLTTLDGPHTN
ncbi:hypothetical protein [Streptomyces sp. NPDC014685]|uniref:hypothetical protein n=1 Tax=Streptomyces sp. NPDC014685 TaxID=3364881 RepID=UPI0036FBD5B8